MGRRLLVVEEGQSGGFITREAVTFNARGLVRDTFQPYHTPLQEFSPPPPDCPKSVVSYDASGRETRRTNPRDDLGALSQVTTARQPLTRSVFDETGKE